MGGAQAGADFTPRDQAGPQVAVTGAGGFCGNVAPLNLQIKVRLRFVNGWGAAGGGERVEGSGWRGAAEPRSDVHAACCCCSY